MTNFWEYNPHNDCWIFLTSFSAQKLRQIEDLKEQQRSGKTLEKNQVCYGLWDRLLNKILSKNNLRHLNGGFDERDSGFSPYGSSSSPWITLHWLKMSLHQCSYFIIFLNNNWLQFPLTSYSLIRWQQRHHS